MEDHIVYGMVSNPVADCHIVRDRKGYRYEHDGLLLDDGAIRPTRPPRVASLMAVYVRVGPRVPFTLKQAREYNYEAGRHYHAMSYYGWGSVYPAELKLEVLRDHWVIINTNDNFSSAARWHLKIVLLDYTLTVEKVERGVYMFHKTTNIEAFPNLDTLADFYDRYCAKFAREGVGWS